MTIEKNTHTIVSADLRMKKLEEEIALKTKKIVEKSKEITELKAYLCAKDPRAPICK